MTQDRAQGNVHLRASDRWKIADTDEDFPLIDPYMRIGEDDRDMRCRKIRKLMNGYMDREITPRTSVLVEDHLARCPLCAREFEELTEIRGIFSKWRAPRPDPYFWTRLSTRIAVKEAHRIWTEAERTVRRWAVGLALVVLLSISFFYGWAHLRSEGAEVLETYMTHHWPLENEERVVVDRPDLTQSEVLVLALSGNGGR